MPPTAYAQSPALPQPYESFVSGFIRTTTLSVFEQKDFRRGVIAGVKSAYATGSSGSYYSKGIFLGRLLVMTGQAKVYYEKHRYETKNPKEAKRSQTGFGFKTHKKREH